MCSKEVQLAISLFEAIDDENISNLIILIEKYNANPNIIIPKLKIAPIHFAVGFENLKIAENVVEIFLKKRADANLYTECDSLLTPLHIAALWGRDKIVKMLLDAGGDLNLKCNEGITPILYAVQENHYEVIEVIKKFVFEQKIEKKKNDLKSLRSVELTKTPRKESKSEHTPTKNSLTSALQNIERNKFTPQRINYNFDVTSPYYINITHRRRDKTRTREEKEKDDEDDDDVNKKNLFELTEKNLKEFSKQMNNVIVVERIAIHKRKSYIAEWREKIQQIRKSDKLDLSYINFLNTCNDVTLLLQEENDSNQEDDDDDDIIEIKSLSDSFVTANSDLQRNNNAIYDLNEQKSSEYIENYEEDYIYSDVENDIVLYEKKIISKDQELINRMNECAISESSISTAITMPSLDYDTDVLRTELKNLTGENPVINKNTKKLYLKRLVKFKKYPERLGIVHEENSSRITYPLELQRTITNYDYLEENISEFLKLESRMVNHFLEKNHIKWREGSSKTSFVYLLLDPRITDNLPTHHKELSKSEVWERFLKAIFYVGKGKCARPYSHLYDAIKIFNNKIDINEASCNRFGQNKNNGSKKLKRIVDVWNDKYGVVCLHIFHNISPVEAYSREASIIETIGIHNLTNIKKGDFYGVSSCYTMRQKRQMGIGLLYRALKIYLAEGESQMKPNDF